MVDSISDFVTRIRNAQASCKKTVDSPMSFMRESIAKVLLDEGYISSYSVLDANEGRTHKVIRLELKYFDGQPVINDIRIVSKPGRRVYSSINRLPLVRNGLGINILSTDRGVMSDVKAKSLSLGGEVLCSIF